MKHLVLGLALAATLAIPTIGAAEPLCGPSRRVLEPVVSAEPSPECVIYSFVDGECGELPGLVVTNSCETALSDFVFNGTQVRALICGNGGFGPFTETCDGLPAGKSAVFRLAVAPDGSTATLQFVQNDAQHTTTVDYTTSAEVSEDVSESGQAGCTSAGSISTWWVLLFALPLFRLRKVNI